MKSNHIIYLLIILSFTACKKDSSETIPDNKKPFIELIYPSNDSYVTEGDTVIITALASDEDGTITSVLFYQNSEIFAIDTVSPWENSYICQEAVNITFSVIAIDNNDNLSDKKSANIYVMEGDKPNVNISKTPFKVLEHDTVVFSVSAQSPNGNITNVDLYINDILYGSDTLEYSEFTVNAIELGDYKVYAIVKDEKGKIKQSSDITFTVNTNMAPEIELSLNSFSGYFPGQPISITAYASDPDNSIDSLFLYVNDSLIYSGDRSHVSGEYFYPPCGGDYTFYATATDEKGLMGYSNNIIANIKPGYQINGQVIDITYSNHNDLVFALEQTNNMLLLLNPYTTFKQEVQLPYSTPIKFCYSEIDDKLYIVYKYQDVISIWDYNSQSLSELTFSASADAIDIEVDDIHRRIYILTSDGLITVNQDNGDLLNTTSVYDIEDIAIDKNNRWLFGCTKTSYIKVMKYDIQNDIPEIIQSNSIIGSYIDQLKINHKNDYFIVPGMGDSRENLAIDTYNLDNIKGEFSYDEWYSYSCFSRDDNYLITAINNYSDQALYVMDANNFTFVEEISIPNSDITIMTTNYSQDKLIVFCYKNYDHEEYSIYFIDVNGIMK